MKCDRCGQTFSHLHTVDVVVDRDYGNLAAQLHLCVGDLEWFVTAAKTKFEEPASAPAAPTS